MHPKVGLAYTFLSAIADGNVSRTGKEAVVLDIFLKFRSKSGLSGVW